MARLVDLEDPDPDDAAPAELALQIRARLASVHVGPCPDTPDRLGADDSDAGPNARLLSAALVCYPIAVQLAGYLDLNSIHDLSRTCRQVRSSLYQYSSHLKFRTLHCANEDTKPAQRLGNALHATFQVWTSYGQNGPSIGRITSGKIGACSRDMVGDCRRCGKIVCRNCIMKPPQPSAFRTRLRRLCRTCIKSPLTQHTSVPSSSSPEEPFYPPDDPSNPHPTSLSPSPSPHLYLTRPPCTCTPTTIWICQPCVQTLRSNDTTYLRSWAWRARYSTCGGMGAGLGEGNEGVECGRNHDFACLGAGRVEQEYEMDAANEDGGAGGGGGGIGIGLDGGGGGGGRGDIGGRHWGGSGYMTHEVVGIGGKVKKKVRRVVRVGEVVKEYEDERVSGKFLEREQEGQDRSWCSWCARIVPGKKDWERERVLGDVLSKTVSVEST